jgi:hypothetical protein
VHRLAVAWSRIRGFALARIHAVGRWPIVRNLRSHQLRRLEPLAGGHQRGTAIVRYYWQIFLDAHAADINGRCLEIGSIATLRRFPSGVTSAEALDVAARPGIHHVMDIAKADALPDNAYDCFIVPFTMHLVYDVDSALYHSIRTLRPGGSLLVNFPCVDYYFANGLDMGTGRPLHMFWWFTPIQVENLLRRAGLGATDYRMSVYGNLFARVAYQMNMPVEELTAIERDHRDDGHPLLICVRVIKPENWTGTQPEPRDPWLPDTQPALWNDRTGHYPQG